MRRGLGPCVTATLSLAILTFPGVAQANPESDLDGFSLTAVENGSIQELQEPSARLSSPTDDSDNNSIGHTVLHDERTGDYAVADISFIDSEPTSGESVASFMVAALEDRVDLDWEAIKGVDSYVIYRDNIKITEVSSPGYTDEDVEPSRVYEYRVEALSRTGSGGRIFGAQAFTPSPGDGTSDSQRYSAMERAEALRAGNEHTSVQYFTHIPDERISAPPVGCEYGSGYSFGGDDRGWRNPELGVNEESSRTYVIAGTDWTSGGTGGGSWDVGLTKVYKDSTGELVDTRQGHMENDPFTVLDPDVSVSFDVRFQVRSSNPFCDLGSASPYIDGTFTMRVNKSGSWQIISGAHKLMPNHEIVIRRFWEDSWAETAKSIYRAPYANPTCLINGACERQNLTGFYGNWK